MTSLSTTVSSTESSTASSGLFWTYATTGECEQTKDASSVSVEGPTARIAADLQAKELTVYELPGVPGTLSLVLRVQG